MTSKLGLRGRIVVLASAITMLLLSILGTVGFLMMASSLRSSVEATVSDRLDTVEQRLGDGTSVGRQFWPDGSEVSVLDASATVEPRDHTVQITRRAQLGGGQVLLVGRGDVAQLDANLAEIRRWLWVSVVASTALVAAFTWVAASRALAPVSAVTARARSIVGARRGELLPVPSTDDELSDLVRTLNEMLLRLRDHEERHRRFVSDASHELRTPLMVLLADAEYAIAHPEDANDLAAQVLMQSNRLTELTDDLLTLATIDESPDLQPRRLGELLDAECDGVEVHVDPTFRSLHVPDISRSLRNLVSNAWRYGDLVSVDIAIDEGSGQVQIHVSDNGPGVPENERETVFDRFHRGECARSRQSGGSGLGLAIVHAEISGAGGTVEVSESESGGARFSIEIPLVDESAGGTGDL